MTNIKFIAFLRGINIGGHHKVPMAELRKLMEKKGFTDVLSFLNTGNILFKSSRASIDELEILLKNELEKKFGFPIPVLLRKAENIQDIIAKDPFKNIEVTKDIRLYVTFLQDEVTADIELPWFSPDGSFKILEVSERCIFSVVDVSKGQTVKGMADLERLFGKNITTRNWNTLLKIAAKI